MVTKKHLYKLSYWKDNPFINKWRVNDVNNLAGISAKWYVPMRLLDLSIEEYIHLLVEKFNVCGLRYYEPTNYLSFYFNKESNAKKFCNYINKIAKQKNFYIY